MDYERLLYLFREYLFNDEEASSKVYVDAMLRYVCGASEDEVKYLKGEVRYGDEH